MKIGQIAVVAISGELDALTAPAASDFFSQQVRDGNLKLVADFSQVEYVSSAGLRVLLATMKAVRLVGGDLRLATVRQAVMLVLELAGFTSLLKIYPQLEQAIGSFAE